MTDIPIQPAEPAFHHAAIRPATVADVAGIVAVARQTWGPAYGSILAPEQIAYMLDLIYDEDKIKEQITTGSQQYLVIGEEEIVAFAAYAPREANEAIYKLHKLYNLSEVQGRGYGKQLIAAVVQKVQQAGSHLLELNVNRYNKARLFYEKHGFTVIYEEDVPIGPYWMNDYVMQKKV